MRVLDLTHTIAENMPVYPGTETHFRRREHL